MIADATIAIDSSGTFPEPDPVASPATVPDSRIIKLRRTILSTDSPMQTIMFGQVGAVSVAVTVFALVEPNAISGQTNRTGSTPEADSDRVFFEIGSATVTAGDLIGLTATDPIPPGGAFYLRITATPSADATLFVVAA